MKPLQRKIAFSIENFTLGSPAQQLLDRFLLGYPHRGAWRRPENFRVFIHGAGDAAEIKQRVAEFGLRAASTQRECLAGADAVVVVPAKLPHDGTLVRAALKNSPAGSVCFVHGSLANSHAVAAELQDLAASRSIPLVVGTAISAATRLPDLAPELGQTVRRALVIGHGDYPAADINALHALHAGTCARKAETPLRSYLGTADKSVRLTRLAGGWAAIPPSFQPLLASALARSDSPQGDPMLDGRTQDIVGSGLVQRLCRDPRCWLLAHHDGLQSVILILNGAVADFTMAIENDRNRTHSWQIYRPPAPAEHNYSRLAAMLQEFFYSRAAPQALNNPLPVSSLLEIPFA